MLSVKHYMIKFSKIELKFYYYTCGKNVDVLKYDL